MTTAHELMEVVERMRGWQAERAVHLYENALADPAECRQLLSDIDVLLNELPYNMGNMFKRKGSPDG